MKLAICPSMTILLIHIKRSKNNMRKFLITILLIATSALQLSAQGTIITSDEIIRRSHGWESSPSLVFGLFLTVFILVSIFIIILSFDINRKFNSILLRPKNEEGEHVERASWFDLFRRIPETEDTYVKDHVYDSIQEYDNSPPSWFNWLFYLSIAFSVVYLLYYHVLKLGPLQEEEYAIEMKAAAIQLEAIQEMAIKLADEPRYTEKDKLLQGEAIYLVNCKMCHGDKCQGAIGPNLTDEYWLHGGSYKDVFKTIFNGVPEKGMISWKKSLKAEEIRLVASYVYSLKGSNPPNAKAPQGNKVSE